MSSQQMLQNKPGRTILKRFDKDDADTPGKDNRSRLKKVYFKVVDIVLRNLISNITFLTFDNRIICRIILFQRQSYYFVPETEIEIMYLLRRHHRSNLDKEAGGISSHLSPTAPLCRFVR